MNIEELLSLLNLNHNESFIEINEKYAAFLEQQTRIERIKKMGGINPLAPQPTVNYSVTDLENTWNLINSEHKYNQYKTSGQIPEQETHTSVTPNNSKPQISTLSSLTKERIKPTGRRLPTRRTPIKESELTETVDTPAVLSYTSPEIIPASPIKTKTKEQINEELQPITTPDITTESTTPIQEFTPPADAEASICIYSDFDGTATRRSGEQTVFTEFYQSMLQKKIPGNYKISPMKSHEEMISLFTAKFGAFDEQFNDNQPDADLLVSRDALAFFRDALNNEQASVNFVTKNRTEYIKAMLTYQGFSAKELSRLTVMDSGNKYFDVVKNLGYRQSKPTYIYIFDDSIRDLNNMVAAAKKNHCMNAVRAFNAAPGCFNWSHFLQDLQAIVGTKENVVIEEPLTDVIETFNEPGYADIEEQLDATTENPQQPVDYAEQNTEQKHKQLIKSTKNKIKLILNEFTRKIGNEDSAAYIPARHLADALEQHLETYEATLLSGPENLKNAGDAFLAQCTKSINTAKIQLNHTLGWGDYLTNLLKTIANAVIKSVNYITGSNFTLFKPVRPVLMPAVEQMEEQLNTDQNQLSNP